MFKSAALTLEVGTIVSLYVGGKAGRRAAVSKNDHQTQGALVLVAHKGPNYVCHGAGRRMDRVVNSTDSSEGANHSKKLYNLGVVLSPHHPSSCTYLTHAVAEYCINR